MIVHDMTKVHIDSDLVAAGVNQKRGEEKLSNDCIRCTLRNDLLTKLRQLAQRHAEYPGPFPRSGPKQVAKAMARTLNKSLRRQPAAMAQFDRLPPELRPWLAQATLPFSAHSALALWQRSLRDSAGDTEAARRGITRTRPLRGAAPRGHDNRWCDARNQTRHSRS